VFSFLNLALWPCRGNLAFLGLPSVRLIQRGYGGNTALWRAYYGAPGHTCLSLAQRLLFTAWTLALTVLRGEPAQF